MELTIINSIKIYQPKNGYRFSMEPFVLTKDLNIKDKDTIIDCCSGCGIISILLSKLNRKCRIIAIETNEKMADLIKLNIELNNLENISILDSFNKVKTNSVDMIIANPPYFEQKSFRHSKRFYNEKFETDELDNILNSMKRVIKNKGVLRLSYHTTRFTELVNRLNSSGFGVKTLMPVYGNKKNNASFLIIESKFDSKNYTVFKQPMYLEDL